MRRGVAVGVVAVACALAACGADTSASGPRRPASVVSSADASAPRSPASADDDAGASAADDDASTAPEAAAPAPFTCQGKTGAKGDLTLSLTSAGAARTAIAHVPSAYDPATGAMLVLNFHGFSSDASQESLLTNMSAAADRDAFVVVYPQGIGNGWSAGDCCTDLQSGPVDDIAFVKDLLAKLEADYCIDPKRVFATGMSNGGFFTHRLACEMSETFAAAAPVAGVLGIAPDMCKPTRMVPLLHFHGTSDPIVPYDGGSPTIDVPIKGHHFRSVPVSTTFWRERQMCLDAGETTYAHGDTTCTRWGDCAGGSEVNLCIIDGGGHTWPGGLPIPFLGKTSTDVDATKMMLDFFRAHPLP